MRTILAGVDVKWQCIKCGHVWCGKAPEVRKRRVRCKHCGSWQVYPGWGDKTWSELCKDILGRDSFSCQRCGATGVKLNVHHKAPLSAGGTSNPENLETLCEKCHGKRHLFSILFIFGIIVGIIIILIFVMWLISILGGR